VNTSKFIILTHGRTGSTYLHQLLDSHPCIRCEGEIFNITNASDNSFATFAQTHYPTLSYFFLRGKISGSSLNYPLNFLIRKYLAQFYGSAPKPKIGFKLIYDQLLYFRPLINWVVTESIPIIHLQRVNILKAAVSLLQARKTGVYISTPGSSGAKEKVTIRPALIVNTITGLSKEKSRAETLLRNNPMLNVTYEDLFAKQSGTLEQIVDFLGAKNSSFHIPDIVKTNPEKISDMLANYDELKQSLTGTRWEKLLD
jgi:LPS sulfotransferase NodH